MTEQSATSYFHDLEPVSRHRDALMDIYSLEPHPAQRRPAVILCHGGPVQKGQKPEPRDWQGFTGYGTLLARIGLVGVTFNHRLYSDQHYPEAEEDVALIVEQVRNLPMVDPDKIGLWFFSGGGVLATPWLRKPPKWLQAVAFNYPVLAPPPDWPGDVDRFNAVAGVGASPELPKLLIRVGREIDFFAHTQEDFISAATQADAALEVIELPQAEHAFEHGPYEARSRQASERAVKWLAETLL